jgi:hypothetical protein
MRGFFRAALCGVILAFAGPRAYGEGEATVQTPPSLAGVAWAGPAPDPAFLEGKTVVVLTYVTWCPKCNAWTGKVASEVKDQSVEKPVVVLAISTDTPPAGALEYMKQRKLVGPNVFHGSDPTIARRFGFANEFINYAIVSPEGKIVDSGNGGRHFADDKKPSYAVARYVAGSEDVGSFRFVRPEMPAALKERLWLLELGVSRDMKKMESGLSPEEVSQLRAAVQSFVEAEVAQVEQLAKSESIADKLAAVDRSTFLTAHFASTPEGRRAKEIVASFSRDKTLKDELNAKRQFEAAMKLTDQLRQRKTLESLGKKLGDTLYGKRASEAAQAVTP